MGGSNSQEQSQNQKKWTSWHTTALLAIIAAMIIFSIIIPKKYIEYTWLLNMVLMTVFVGIAGLGINGRLSGVLIDSRNRWNLSRLQTILWTILILSAFFTIAIWNILNKSADPLAIQLHEELWFLMGISTTSLVGSPLIISGKKEKKADPEEKKNQFVMVAQQRGVKIDPKTFKIMDNKPETTSMTAQGQVACNAKLEDAGISDLFKGEETGNVAYLDLGRIQMLYFTVITIMTYAVMIFNLLHGVKTGAKIDTFPALSSSLIALLAISHGGYLAHKAVSHSKLPGGDS